MKCIHSKEYNPSSDSILKPKIRLNGNPYKPSGLLHYYTTRSCVVVMSNLTSVSIPVPVLKRARELGINVSGTAREAVIAKVQKEEKARGIAAKQTPGTTTPLGGQSECRP